MSLRSAKIHFRSKYQMLMDFAGTVTGAAGSTAATVANRHFDNFYLQLVAAYETLLDAGPADLPEEMATYVAQSTEINQLLIQLGEATESAAGTSQLQVKGSHSQVSQPKLPSIELPKFSGKI